MGIFSVLFGRREKPINVNDEANHQLVAGLVAHFQAEEADSRGSVAGPHLHRIAIKHVRVSQALDKMLEANERSRNQS